jgi:hypothetical protein
MLNAIARGLVKGLAVLLALGLCWLAYRASTGAADSAPGAEDAREAAVAAGVIVPAEELAREYEAGAAHADTLYKGKRLAVVGTLKSIEIGPALNLAGNTASSTVWAQLQSSESDAVTRLAKDQSIRVVCVGGGVSQRKPLLYDCLIVH